LIVHLENQSEGPEVLFVKFFEKYSNVKIFDIKKPLGLNEESRKPVKTNYRMLIMTPVEPFRNSSRNVTKSTFK
jgi:hypothetical protein